MKKSDHDIDNLFKTHFDDLEVPVTNKDALWRRISPDRNRRRFALFMFLAVVSAAAMFLSWTIDEKASHGNGAGGASDESIVSNRKTNIKEESTIKQLTERSEKSPEKADRKDKVESKNKAIENAKLNKKAVRFNTPNPSELIASNGTSITSQYPVLSHEGPLGIDKHVETVEEFVPAVQGQDSTSIYPMSIHTKLIDKRITVGRTILEMSPLPSRRIDHLNQQSDESNYLSSKRLNCPIIGNSSSAKGNLFVDAYLFGGRPIDHVKIQNNTQEQTDYLDLWNNRFQSLSTFSGGLMLGYQFGNGIEVSTGAEYQRIESQYQTVQRVTETITVFDPMAFFFEDDAGNTVWVADSVSAVSIFDRTSSIANRSTLLSIPFQVSYPLLRKGLWQLRVVGGGSFNVSIEQRGVFLRDNQQVIQLDDANTSTFLAPHLGLSIEGGLQMSTLIGDRMEVYFSPRYRYNRQSYLAQSEALSVSRDFIGLRIGAKYHLY